MPALPSEVAEDFSGGEAQQTERVVEEAVAQGASQGASMAVGFALLWSG